MNVNERIDVEVAVTSAPKIARKPSKRLPCNRFEPVTPAATRLGPRRPQDCSQAR